MATTLDETKRETKIQSVQCFGRKKTAVAVAHVKRGRGLVKVNGVPIELMKPPALKLKVLEPFMVIRQNRLDDVRIEDFDIRVRVKGGGYTSQLYAIRQAISKGLIAFFQKFRTEHEKENIKNAFLNADRTLLVADPRRRESKKFGGPGAR